MTSRDEQIRWAAGADDIDRAHRLFLERIGPRLVEDEASFRLSAVEPTEDWRPRLGLVKADGALVAAQLGGLLPAVGLVSLPYTAVAEGWEGRGVYNRLKAAMLAALRQDARALGLPEPRGNVSEEVEGSAQYRRKVERSAAVRLPLRYVAPAAQGLSETELALTYEPLDGPVPVFSPDELIAIVAAVYRGLYRVAEPERDASFLRVKADVQRRAAGGRGA